MRSLKEAKLKLLEMHYNAKVGHIGGNLSCIEIMRALVEVQQSQDEIVISKGHAAGAWYVTKWAQGYDIPLERFHQDNGLCGHLPHTGSLGHGLGIAAGIALQKKLMHEDGVVYCLTSDGEWDEGSNYEAFNAIVENGLRVRIVIDWNGWQGFKSSNYKDLKAFFEAYWRSWGVSSYTCDGHDVVALKECLLSYDVILASTHKGNGVSFLTNKMESHYEPLTDAQYRQAFKELSDAKEVS